jgi:nucleotide-binding universal stress UspA family protein
MDTAAARTQQPHVVVGVERSSTGYAALHAAVGIARSRSLPVLAVRATSSLESDGREYIEQAFAEALGGIPEGLEVEEVPVFDGAVDAIRRAADGPADVIVVGNSGKGLFHALWSGSVGRSLLKGLPCQVVLVPAPEMQKATRRSVRRLRRGHADVWSSFESEQPQPHGRPFQGT